MAKVSVIIASRNEPYLFKTIEDICQKATGDIEVIVILDGEWDVNGEYSEDPRVSYLYNPVALGLRRAVNQGVALSRGDYILKCDAHTMFAKGFDEVLVKNSQPKMIQVPRRYPLDPEKWEVEKRKDNKYPIDEMLLSDSLQGEPTGRKFTETLTDLQTAQGSCWFMEKEWFNYLELEDYDTYGFFYHEFQEIGFKCWLSGGRVVRNIDTWYAHWHKPKTHGRGYQMDGEKEKARKAVEKWRTEKMFSKQIHDFQWMLDKFNNDKK